MLTSSPALSAYKISGPSGACEKKVGRDSIQSYIATSYTYQACLAAVQVYRNVVHDSAGVENGSNPTTASSTTTPLVIKMMTDYASWRREIESREILASAQSSIIPVDW